MKLGFGNIRTLSLRAKFASVVVVSACGLLALAGFWVSGERARILAEKQEKVKNLVEIPYSVITRYEQMVKDGTMSRKEAQDQALHIIASMRYDQNNYFWINDSRPTMVMHPMKPQLNGKDLSDYKDPAGKALFVEMVAVVKESGSGFVSYGWPKPGHDKDGAVPKLSYVKGFEPWGWIVGTGIYIDDVDAVWKASIIRASWIVLLCLVVLLLISASVSRSIFHRLRDLTERIQDVAEGEGDLSKRIDIGTNDEVGELARWFNVFISKLHDIVAQLVVTAESVAEASKGVLATSQHISANSEETSTQANVVAAAGEQVSANVGVVATGSEEMLASIREISKSSSEAARVAKTAVGLADNTNQTISRLGDSSEEIGKVVKMITSIARQTNLLALNATIEAARAGEAGKGFAVVANEVKELAKETAKATEDISRKIGVLQGDTKGAVQAIGEISAVINQINDISNTIASAVEEQTATTNEMGRNIGEAAKGSSEIARNIAGVAEAARSTSTGASETNTAASELARTAAHMQKLLQQFKLQRQGGQFKTANDASLSSPSEPRTLAAHM
jgi:methyl-accepting chemotaxis protein